MYIVVGVNKYLPEAEGLLCPPDAPEISVSITDNSQICSLLCSNIETCGGFNFNKQTGSTEIASELMMYNIILFFH